MAASFIHRRELLALLAVATLSATGVVRAEPHDPVCVIVSSSSAQQGLSIGELRRIFLHQATDDVQGNRFIPLNAPPKSSVRTHFDQFLFGFSADEMARYWVDQRIRGTQAPRVVPTVDMLLRVVEKLPGAISYVLASQLTPQVKALRLDGKRHTDVGYALSKHK